jgi:alpha-1,6-mannosyltransferase
MSPRSTTSDATLGRMTSIAPRRTRGATPADEPNRDAGLGRPGWVGAAGAVLIAASSWWVGAVPHAWQTHPPAQLSWFAIGSIEPRIAFYAGLILMTTAWISLGRHVLGTPTDTSARRLQRTALVWAAPMMVAIPLASRDLWAYATQGRLIQRGFDPYSYAPFDMPGVFSQNVSPGWVQSPAPYGPFWLGLNHAVAATYGEHVLVAVFLLRIPVLAGLLILLWTVPRLAQQAGLRADRALWLTAASPFTIELVLGAGHNDLLMAALMTAGATLALRAGPAVAVAVPAAALMALAAGVKSPAVIGLAFVVPLVLSRRGDQPPSTLRPVVTVTVATLLSGVVTFAAVSLVTGFGLGWVHQVGSSAQLVNWLSLPTDVAIFSDIVTGHVDGASHLDDPMRHWRTAGLTLSAVLVAVIWLGAVLVAIGRRPLKASSRVSRTAAVVTMLAAAMLTLTLLGPAVQLWYLLWALPFLIGATDHRRTIIALIAIQTAMVFTVDPHGLSVTMKPVVTVIIAVAVAVTWLALHETNDGASTSADDDSHGARAGVHADGGGHL